MRSRSSPILWLLIALYFAASITYFVATAGALYDRSAHADQHAEDPFEMNYDTLTVTRVSDEARAAGLTKGAVIESLNGQPYRGEAQWISIDRKARAGQVLRIGVHDAKGHRRTADIHLRTAHRLPLSTIQWINLLVLQFVGPLICLLVGYWVIVAKPAERNAWLILLLLTMPEVLFGRPDWWTGGLRVFQEVWFQVFQNISGVLVLLIGIYFPERWRLDRRWPWLKWVLIAPQLAGLVLALGVTFGEFYYPSIGLSIQTHLSLVDKAGSWLALACVFLYWVAIFDKLRSASSSDVRRRLRVLCGGSVVGLGTLLVVFVLPPALQITIPRPVLPWLLALGALFTLFFPFSLAYVVVVQRALDLRILLRMGTKYVLARISLRIFQLIVFAIVVWQLTAPLLSRQSIQLHDVIIPLLLAALFVALAHFGLGRRLQFWLDRQFFREAYHSELVLSELSEQARTLTESDSLLSTVCRRISEVLHVPQISVLLRGSQVFRLQQAVGIDFVTPLLLDESSKAVETLTRDQRPTTLYREDPESWFAQAGTAERHTLDAVNAELLLPLPGRDKLLGLMTLGPKLSDEPYSPSDLRLLQSVAQQTGLALEVSELAHSLAREAAQRERINREIEIAREVQEHLFPQSIPQLPGISLAGACRPAQAVGGDYFDFIQLTDGRLALAVGDVSGKGVSAALVMAGLRASIHGMMLEEGVHNLSKLMANVNRVIYEGSTITRYATFFFAIFDPLPKQLSYVNAGHNPPVILREGCSPLLLEAGGPVIGLIPNLRYEEQTVALESGDLLIAYTDGISEAMTVTDEEWGEARMVASALGVRSMTADAIVAKLFADADLFTNGAPQQDDMTLLVMKL